VLRTCLIILVLVFVLQGVYRVSEPNIWDYVYNPTRSFLGEVTEFAGGLLGFDDVDEMYVKRAGGREVVEDAIDRILTITGDENTSVKPLLMHTAEKESRFGTHPETYKFRVLSPTETVGHGGIAQVTDRSMVDILRRSRESNSDDGKRLARMLDKFKEAGIDFRKAYGEKGGPEWREWLEIPINSLSAARLHYYANNRPLPKMTGDGDVDRAAIEKYYTEIYRGKKRPGKRIPLPNPAKPRE
jgi:hypothetical protein